MTSCEVTLIGNSLVLLVYSYLELGKSIIHMDIFDDSLIMTSSSYAYSALFVLHLFAHLCELGGVVEESHLASSHFYLRFAMRLLLNFSLLLFQIVDENIGL